MATYKTFTAALTALPVAANDNEPKRKKRTQHHYRGTLPALRWLYDNHPNLAPTIADAVKAITGTNWNPEAVDGELEIRPTIGEIERAASTGRDADGTIEWLAPETKLDSEGNPYIQLGSLKFRGNTLVEYGRTRKGRRLEPRDRMSARSSEASADRNPNWYIRGLKGAVPSPLHAEPYQRPLSAEPALPPMYDPQGGVEDSRAILRAFGVDGSVRFDDLPFPAMRCPTAIAPGAEFFGGVVQMSGNSSSGASMWESPEAIKGEVWRIVEEVAARGTLSDIGELVGGKLEDGKSALVDAARILSAANDNKHRKKRVA